MSRAEQAGLNVGTDHAFKKKCDRALRNALNAHVGLTKQGEFTNVRFLLTGQAQVNEGLPLLPFATLGNMEVWIGMAISAESENRKTYIHHVSLQLYVGSSSDTDKIQWMRAEWDPRTPAIAHAQPHWQFVAERDIDGGGVFSDEDLSPQGTVGGISDALLTGYMPKPDISITAKPSWRAMLDHFHYAMATDWHLKVPTGNWRVPSNEDELLRWIERCICYIREQIEHCNKKAGLQQ